jgi:hypothetical protein
LGEEPGQGFVRISHAAYPPLTETWRYLII